MARTNADIVKGSKLMVFITKDGESFPIGFATSHALNITTNTTEILTKDHGDFPSQVIQSISWEVTAENLYSNAGEGIYMDLITSKKQVELIFAPANNYDDVKENGVIDNDNKEWVPGDAIAQGKAIVTSFSINAPAGDNATMSVTFTGVGEFTTVIPEED